jgi:hypothetical protein
MCATDMTVTLTADTLPIRTVKDGHWKKNAYLNSSYSVSLSGLLQFEDDNSWTGWDMIYNWLNYTDVQFRISFTSDEGEVRTIQGYAIVTTSTIGISSGALVKGDFDMTGNGMLMVFDGLVPCDSEITSITSTGNDISPVGDVVFNYTFTGNPYQVKYRLNSAGDYFNALATGSFTIPGLPLSADIIEIIPVCGNGFEGTGKTLGFIVSHNNPCQSIITNLTYVAPNTIKIQQAGSPPQMRYSIDSGFYFTRGYTDTLVLPSLEVGTHTITVYPICANVAMVSSGTPRTLAFTVTSQPAQSILNFTFNNQIIQVMG